MRTFRDHWRSPEIVWPLAIGLGFLGAWPGNALGWPLAVALGGALGPLLLCLRLSAEGSSRLLWSVPLGGAIGAAAAWAEGAYAGRLSGSPLALLSGSDPVGRQIAAGVAGEDWVAEPPADVTTWVLLLLPYTAALLLGRPLRGLLAWLIWFAVASECTAHVVFLATGMLARGGTEAGSLAAAWPPWWLLALIAGAVAVGHIQDRRIRLQYAPQGGRGEGGRGDRSGMSGTFGGGLPGGGWALSLVTAAILTRLGLASAWWAWLRGELPVGGVW